MSVITTPVSVYLLTNSLYKQHDDTEYFYDYNDDIYMNDGNTPINQVIAYARSGITRMNPIVKNYCSTTMKYAVNQVVYDDERQNLSFYLDKPIIYSSSQSAINLSVMNISGKSSTHAIRRFMYDLVNNNFYADRGDSDSYPDKIHPFITEFF